MPLNELKIFLIFSHQRCFFRAVFVFVTYRLDQLLLYYAVPAPPPLPSLVPKAPPPPPPPLGAPGEKRNISETQKAALEKLK